MSNTAVLFNALQPQRTQPALHSHHHTAAVTPTNTIADTKMYNHSNSPSRRHRGTTKSTSVGTFVTKSTHSTNDSSIRRGADIVRKHIQQQQQHVMLNSSTATAVVSNQQVASTSSVYRMEPSQRTVQPGYKYDVDDDDEILVHDSEEEVTTEDHISVTSWSEYDALPSYRDHDKNGDSGRYPRRNTGASSVEVDPPSVDDWSIDVDLDDVSHSNNNYEPSNSKDDIGIMKYDTERNVGTPRSKQEQQTVPAPIANYDNTTMLMMTQNERSNQKLQPVGGFISSDDEEEEEEEGEESMQEEKGTDKLKNRDDFDDSNSDIVEINDALFDPFHPSSSSRGDHAVAVVSLSSPSKISNKLLSTTTAATNAVSNHTKEQRSPSNSVDPTNGGGSSSSGSDSSPYRHRTVALSSSPNSGIRKGYPLPFHIQESPPNSMKNNVNPIKSNNRNGTPTTAAMAANSRPSFFMDYDVDAYCGYNADSYGGDHDEKYDSPEKPVQEVPIHTPSTISNLSSPGMVQQPSQQNSTTGSRTYYSQRSSAIMLQYDQLLRDPAYLHAQNAGFIWQSIVGQHIRFPSTWWNGARGPPINTGYDNNDSHHPTDANNIPWMYFGRHTIPDHPVLNQLVKCRASAGRLLLHIVVQDLMTRTPIQDIVIGCFHPNSKGIRSPNSPALKRYENCRDIWMAVRKRSHTAVAATDSLIYSPNHWENPNPSNSRRSTSAYNYSISRSPLGSGQRVINQNVRAVFGDKAPLETIFLSEDELYERLAARILQQQQQNTLLLSSSGNNKNNMKSKSDSTLAAATTPQDNDLSPPLAILQELVFA